MLDACCMLAAACLLCGLLAALLIVLMIEACTYPFLQNPLPIPDSRCYRLALCHPLLFM